MITGYSTLTAEDAQKEIAAMKKATRTIMKSRASARAFLIRAGILTKSGKQLAKKYR